MVVEQLKSREADDLWVSLGNCDIRDSKIASLTEALTQNATVTAVDLSRNGITATGAQVHVSARATHATRFARARGTCGQAILRLRQTSPGSLPSI